MALTTPSGAKPLATASARSAVIASAAIPLKMSWPPLEETRMPTLPVLARIFACTSAVSTFTARSMMATTCALSSNSETLVVPTFLAWM